MIVKINKWCSFNDIHSFYFSYLGSISAIDTSSIEEALDSGQIPIIQGLGMTDGGQMLALDVNDVTTSISKHLQPLKVMLLNTTGGFTNEFDEVSTVEIDIYTLLLIIHSLIYTLYTYLVGNSVLCSWHLRL